LADNKPEKIMTKQELIDEIKQTNNGYLFVANHAQHELAKQHPDTFVRFGLGMNGNLKIGLTNAINPRNCGL
jgi:hypothetical protein